jgi:hypothetical protein
MHLEPTVILMASHKIRIVNFATMPKIGTNTNETMGNAQESRIKNQELCYLTINSTINLHNNETMEYACSTNIL